MMKGGLPTATTYYKKHKISKGETIAQSLKDRFDYGQNPDKTENGELISSYGCDHMTADAEFLLSKAKYKAILQVGIRKATAGVYDEEGLKFTWSVENIGDYSVSFDKNMIAQIVLNGEDYAFETEAVTLEPGEAYSVDISIPYPVARQNGTNNVKITATTGDTTATYKESFTH